MVFGSLGDVLLGRGMQGAQITLSHLVSIITALGNPWVFGGIALLLLFFASYLSALSFADLTFVLPATSMSYIFMALLAKFFLHETVSPLRWAGILLISLGVGFVTRGPSVTPKPVAKAESPLVDATALGGER